VKPVLDYLRQLPPPLLWLCGYFALVILISLGVSCYRYGWREVWQGLCRFLAFPVGILFAGLVWFPLGLGFGILAGVFFFLKGFWLFRDYKIVANTPLIPIHSVALGFVSIRGKAQSDHPIASPVSGTPCCLYKVEIARLGGGPEGGLQDKWSIVVGSRFSLSDDTGKMAVDAHDVDEDEYDVPPNYSGEMHGGNLSAIPQLACPGQIVTALRKIDEVLRTNLHEKAESRLRRPEWVPDGNYYVEEFLMLPGKEYQVTGTCVENPDSQDATDRYLICKSGNQGTFAISSKIGQKKQIGLLSSAVGMIIGGAALILMCGLILVLTLSE
jgi:hypothetical protein